MSETFDKSDIVERATAALRYLRVPDGPSVDLLDQTLAAIDAAQSEPWHVAFTRRLTMQAITKLALAAGIALFIGFAAAFIGATGGAIVGVVSAYMGGKTDLLIQRVVDIFLAFPLLILALAIVSVLGRSIPNLIIAIAIPVIPRTARIVRSSALSAKENVYVEAARAVGSSHIRVMARHILPNIMAPYLIILTAQLGSSILTEASLSFLGLGTAEPTPSWGLMLSGGAPLYAEKAPWVAIFPGVAISLAVFGFNLFGDSLRDALDPRLRHRS